MFHAKYKFIPKRIGDRSDSITLNNNAKKILGFNAKKDIRTYIKDFIAFSAQIRANLLPLEPYTKLRLLECA